MSTAPTWEVEKQAHASHLYTTLAALVGDVAAMRWTSASCSWRSPAGVQGHWREEHGQFWLGRIIWTLEGRHSEQLVLSLQEVGEGDDRRTLAHPTAHHWRLADAPVRSSALETAAIYTAAQAFLSQLCTEMQMMFVHLQEDAMSEITTDEPVEPTPPAEEPRRPEGPRREPRREDDPRRDEEEPGEDLPAEEPA